MLKHVANHEARVVRHNLLRPEAMVEVNHDAVPAAVFSHPQIAADIARTQYWIHPAMPELVENALLQVL